MNKIEQLIDEIMNDMFKYLHLTSYTMENLRNIRWVLKEHLKDTTEDKPTVATVLAYEQWYKEALSEVASILKKEKCVWVPYRNWIERWIEVAEELLANSV